MAKTQKEFNQQNYQRNRDKRIKKCKDWREANPEKYNEYVKSESQKLKERRLADPEYRARANQQSREHYHKIKHEDPIRFILQSARKRAKDRGHEFDLERKDIIIPDTCPVFGVPLVKADGTKQPNSMSLDRIDNTKGYVKNNVQVISNKANVMKNDATPEELVQFAKWVLETYGK